MTRIKLSPDVAALNPEVADLLTNDRQHSTTVKPVREKVVVYKNLERGPVPITRTNCVNVSCPDCCSPAVACILRWEEDTGYLAIFKFKCDHVHTRLIR